MITSFFNIDDFPDFKKISGQYKVILEELHQNSFWMRWGSDQYDPTGHCKFLTGDWTVCPVYFGNYNPYAMNAPHIKADDMGALIEAMPQRFPKTTDLLQAINSINYAAFSRLHPKSKLATHRHKNPAALIYHLGLMIPAGNSCGLKVGDQVHVWKEAGDALIFDDTIDHSAWNDSDQERVILYIDFSYKKMD